MVVRVSEIGDLIARGAIRIGDRVGRIADPVGPGDVVTVDAASLIGRGLVPEPLSLAIHHEDADLLICDKPAGMHVHPIGPFREGTLLNQLLWHCGARADEPWGAWRPSPLHRLDRAASGLIAIAKSAAAHELFRRAFAGNQVERRYRAMVHGRIAADAGTVDAPLGRDPAFDYRRAIVAVERGGRPAITHWSVIARQGDRTLVELVLETGRTHQIRAHLASLGHPIVGDRLYASDAARAGAEVATAIALHAIGLRLRHPRTGDDVACTSPAPDRFGEA